MILTCIGLAGCTPEEDVLLVGLNARVVEIDTGEMILYIQDTDESAAVFGERCALDCTQAAEEDKLIFVDYDTSVLTGIPFTEFQVGDELVVTMYESQKEGAKDASARAEQVQLGTQRPLFTTLVQTTSRYSDFTEHCWSGGSGYQYTGYTVFTEDDRTLMVQDIPENLAEELLFSQYYFKTIFEFDGLLGLQGSDTLKLSAKNEAENAAEGMYFEKVIIHEFDTLTQEDFSPGGGYFANEELSFRFVDQADVLKESYGLTDYAIVYIDLSWQWSEQALSMGPQLGDGRYERLYLVGKTTEADGWKIYECFWGELVLDRVPPDAAIEITREGKALLIDYFQQRSDRVYFLGEEPGDPREDDRRIDRVAFLGSEVTFETIGEAYLVETSIYTQRMESPESEPITQWWPVEQEHYLVLGRGMDGKPEEVRGEQYVVRHSVSRMILEQSYGVADWEVALRHDGSPYPHRLAIGRWDEMPLSLVGETPEIQRLDGWEPVYREGDFWDRYVLDGLSILRYYDSREHSYGIFNIELTRDDFSTPRGIRLGSTRDEVMTAYPELRSGDYWGKYPGEDCLWYCDDPNDFGPALIFFFEDNRVSRIVLNDMFN